MIVALGGDDVVRAGAGKDLVCGGAGARPPARAGGRRPPPGPGRARSPARRPGDRRAARRPGARPPDPVAVPPRAPGWVRGRRGATALVAATLVLLATATAWAVGELTQKPGTAGCVSELGERRRLRRRERAPGRGIDHRQPGWCERLRRLHPRPRRRGGARSRPGRDAHTAAGRGRLHHGSRELRRVPRRERPSAGPTRSPSAPTARAPTSHPSSAMPSPSSIAAADGTLTQKPGTAGCISETGTGGACADGRALAQAHSVTVSPDGASVYVTASLSDAVAVFDRAADGTLTQKPGVAGCIVGGGDRRGVREREGARRRRVGHRQPRRHRRLRRVRIAAARWRPSIAPPTARSPRSPARRAASPRPGPAAPAPTGGRSSRPAPWRSAATARTPTSRPAARSRCWTAPPTARSTQKPGTAGCISETGTGGACADGRGLDNTRSVTISPDGRSGYVASDVSDALAVFDRAADGTLTQKPGVAGCISDTGGGPCVEREGARLRPLGRRQRGRRERLRRVARRSARWPSSTARPRGRRHRLLASRGRARAAPRRARPAAGARGRRSWPPGRARAARRGAT